MKNCVTRETRPQLLLDICDTLKMHFLVLSSRSHVKIMVSLLFVVTYEVTLIFDLCASFCIVYNHGFEFKLTE